VQDDGGGRSWNLVAVANQTSVGLEIQLSGTATFVQDNHPTFGSVSARGGLLGAVVLGSVHVAESYSVTTPLFPSPPNDCYIDTDGGLILNGDTMTVSLNEHDGCDTTGHLRESTSQFVMRRK
jgi:hypothetical protein